MAEVVCSPTAEPVRKGGTKRMEALQQFGFKPNDGEQQKIWCHHLFEYPHAKP